MENEREAHAFESFKQQLAKEENWTWAARYVVAFEEGRVTASSFHSHSYSEVLRALEALAKSGKIPAEWRIRLQEDSIRVRSQSAKAEDRKEKISTFEGYGVGVLEGSDTTWSLEHAQDVKSKDFDKITKMDWRGVSSEKEIGKIEPPVSRGSFVEAIRIPVPSGSMRIQLKQREVEEKIDIPSIKKEYKKQEGDIRVTLPVRGIPRTIPVLPGFEIVAAVLDEDEESLLVGLDGRTPLVWHNLDAGFPKAYVLRKATEVNGDPAHFIPSKEEQEYWGKVMPLPPDVLRQCRENPITAPVHIADFMAKEFNYMCHDAYGEFLERHVDELPLIVDELKLGHCDILSWAAAAYTRQLGISSFLTRELVSGKNGGFKRDAGHARLALISVDGRVRFFDPTTRTQKSDFFTPEKIPAQVFESLEDSYKRSHTEGEKRLILRYFRKELNERYEKFFKEKFNTNKTERSVFSGVNDIDGALPAHQQPKEFFDTQRPIVVNNFEIEGFSPLPMLGSKDDVGEWLKKVEEENRFSDGLALIIEALLNGEDDSLDKLSLEERSFFFVYVNSLAQRRLPIFNDDTPFHIAFSEKHFTRSFEFYMAEVSQYREIARFSESEAKRIINAVKNEYIKEVMDGDIDTICFAPDALTRCALPGLDDFVFDKNFIDKVRSFGGTFDFEYFEDLHLNLNKFKRSGKVKGNTREIVAIAKLIHQANIFVVRCAQALNDPLRRARVEQEFNVDRTCWRAFARTLENVDGALPKEIYRGSVFDYMRRTFEKTSTVGHVESRYKKLNEIFFIDRREEAATLRRVEQFFLENESASAQADYVQGELEFYDPQIHDVKDIAWQRSTQPGVIYARRRTPVMETAEWHVFLDTEASRISGFDFYFHTRLILKKLKELGQKKGKRIAVTNGLLPSYIHIDRRTNIDQLAILLVAQDFYKENKRKAHDMRVIKNGKSEIPQNIFYLSDSEGRVAAVKYQLGKKAVASTYDAARIEVFPRVNKDWVQKGATHFFNQDEV